MMKEEKNDREVTTRCVRFSPIEIKEKRASFRGRGRAGKRTLDALCVAI